MKVFINYLYIQQHNVLSTFCANYELIIFIYYGILIIKDKTEKILFSYHLFIREEI